MICLMFLIYRLFSFCCFFASSWSLFLKRQTHRIILKYFQYGNISLYSSAEKSSLTWLLDSSHITMSLWLWPLGNIWCWMTVMSCSIRCSQSSHTEESALGSCCFVYSTGWLRTNEWYPSVIFYQTARPFFGLNSGGDGDHEHKNHCDK